MFKFKSFLDNIRSREEAPPPYQQPGPTSHRNRQYDAKEPASEHRHRKRHSKGSARKVPRPRSSSNVRRSRPDLAKATGELHITPPKLDIVTEDIREINVAKSSSRKRRSAPRQNPSSSDQHVNQHVSQEKVRDYSSHDLTQEPEHLRDENAASQEKVFGNGTGPSKYGRESRDAAEWDDQAQRSEELTQQNPVMSENLQRKKSKGKETERSRNRMSRKFSTSSKVESNIHDDIYFKDGVQELQLRIFNWVKSINWDVPNRNRSRMFIVPTVYKFFKKTCPDFKNYLSSRREIGMLIQAHIWQYFIREVFCQPCFWAETRDRPHAEQDISNNPFSLLRAQLRREVAFKHEVDFQEWRVSSARLIAKRDPKLVEENIVFAAEMIMAPLTHDLKPIQNGDLPLRSLESIFRSAISLDFAMQQQRPDYVFFPTLVGDGVVYFDEDKYEIPDDEHLEVVHDKTPVRLVIEPSFCRFGDSEGHNYDEEVCLLKGIVDL